MFVIGLNQSWRETQDVDAHVAVDQAQMVFSDPAFEGWGGKPYYEAVAAKRTLFHTGPDGKLGLRLDRHDAVVFGRHPFRRRHLDGCKPFPPLDEDGGVALKPGPETGPGSVGLIALQIAAHAGFRRIWLVGFDMSDTKFTGKSSESSNHDRIWRRLPPDVLERVRVIAPSATEVFTVVPWPWRGAKGRKGH